MSIPAKNATAPPTKTPILTATVSFTATAMTQAYTAKTPTIPTTPTINARNPMTTEVTTVVMMMPTMTPRMKLAVKTMKKLMTTPARKLMTVLIELPMTQPITMCNTGC